METLKSLFPKASQDVCEICSADTHGNSRTIIVLQLIDGELSYNDNEKEIHICEECYRIFFHMIETITKQRIEASIKEHKERK